MQNNYNRQDPFELSVIMDRTNIHHHQKKILNKQIFSYDGIKPKEILLFDVHSGNKILIINNLMIEIDLPKIFNNLMVCAQNKIILLHVMLDKISDRLIIEYTPLFSAA